MFLKEELIKDRLHFMINNAKTIRLRVYSHLSSCFSKIQGTTDIQGLSLRTNFLNISNHSLLNRREWKEVHRVEFTEEMKFA